MEIGWLFVLSCLAAVGEIVSGLKCYECYGARSNLDCILKGRVRVCNPSQKSCQNTLRVSNGQFRIYKGCKQTQACNNDLKKVPQRKNAQNKSFHSVQCKMRFSSTVCSCCCNNDKCNDKAMYCREKPISPPPRRQTRKRYPARQPAMQDDAPTQVVVVEDKSACGTTEPYCSDKGRCEKDDSDGTWSCKCQRGHGGSMCDVTRAVNVVACWSRTGEC